MCGIIGVVVKDGARIGENLSQIYEHQKMRGQEGAGFSIANGKHRFRIRFRMPTKAIEFAKRQSFKAGDKVLFHHRYPTSTPNYPAFNHPISNEDGSIYLIHNGHISNSDELFDKYAETHQFETMIGDEKGKKKTITDSEVIIHLLEENLPPEAISGAFKGIVEGFKATADRLDGTFAIAVSIGEVIYLFKKSNPIVVFRDPQGNVWFASMFPNGKGYTKIAELEDGELGMLSKVGYTQLKVFDDMKPKEVHYSNLTMDDLRGFYFSQAQQEGRCVICGEPTTGYHKYCEDCWGMKNKNNKEVRK